MGTRKKELISTNIRPSTRGKNYNNEIAKVGKAHCFADRIICRLLFPLIDNCHFQWRTAGGGGGGGQLPPGAAPRGAPKRGAKNRGAPKRGAPSYRLHLALAYNSFNYQ